MADPTTDTSRVSYTVKELLAEIALKVSAIDTKLDAKADLAFVQALVLKSERQNDAILSLQEQALARSAFGSETITEFKAQEKIVSEIRAKLDSLDAVSTYRRWLIAVGGAQVLSVIGLVLALVQ